MISSAPMTYPESVDWLFSTQWFGIKLGLDPARHLLRQAMGYPEHGVKVVHVAGTNGKGSTCAMMDSILRASGRRSGLFTSPHLEDFRERVQVSGEMIPEADCARILGELRMVCEAMDPHPTFFEITLALAMRWFRECECDWIVLETGMGGLHDATTAVPADLCVITPIGMDHSEWLGDTLGKIAGEKAGIFLPGVPVVSSPQEPEAALVLAQAANEIRAPLEWVREPLRGYHISLHGEHQAWNAALATLALHRAGLPLGPDIVRQGLGRIDWPGRFERFGDTILDAAHNPHAAKVLIDAWREEFGDRKAAVVFSTSSGKDVAGLLSCIACLAERWFVCPLDSPRAIPTRELMEHWPSGASRPDPFGCFRDAYHAALATGLPVLVTGSIFLVGEARSYLTGGCFHRSAQ